MSVACAEINDQQGVFSFRSLYDAYLNCRRHKRNANNTLKFEADLLGNLTNLQQMLASYLGHFKHADSYRLCNSLFRRYSFLTEVFILESNSQNLVLRTKPVAMPSSFTQQHAFFFKQYPNTIVLVQLGRFCELFNKSAIIASMCLGLKIRRNIRGFDYQTGFPMRHLRGIKQRLKVAPQNYIVVAEQGMLSNGLKQRVMTEHFMVGNSQKAISQIS